MKWKFDLVCIDAEFLTRINKGLCLRRLVSNTEKI